MKYLALLALFATSTAMADTSVGCGLGMILFPKQSLVSSTTRSITNAVTMTQVFGPSSGTSGCAQHSIVKKESEKVYYAEANLETLMIEMAQGQGDYVVAFARTLGCNDGAISTFTQMTREHYNEIFPSSRTSGVEMLEHVQEKLSLNPVLAAQCATRII